MREAREPVVWDIVDSDIWNLIGTARGTTAEACRGFAHTHERGRDHSFYFSASIWQDAMNLERAITESGRISEYDVDVMFFEAAAIIIGNLGTAVADCAPGVVTVIAYALMALNRQYGDVFVNRIFRLVHNVFAAAKGSDGVGKFRWTLFQPGADGSRLAPNFAAWPRLIVGRLPEHAGRECSRFLSRMFMHPTDKTSYSVQCSSGLRSTEVWFHNLLRHGDCIIEDAAMADFLFVPFYTVCEEWKRNHWGSMLRTAFVRPYFELAEELSDVLRRLVTNSKRPPADHVVLFPEEKWPLFGTHLQSVPRVRFLVVEARPVHCPRYDRRAETLMPGGVVGGDGSKARCHHCHDCFRLGHDVVVPSFIDHFIRTRLLRFNAPRSQRRWLMVFHGSSPIWTANGAYGEIVNYRHKLNIFAYAEWPLSDVIVGGYHDEYERMLGSSRFCLIPKGLGYWTHRLYEAVLAGCIPVILSDRVVLPFQGIHGIDWANFSIRWPEDCLGLDLERWLRFLDTDVARIVAMKRALDASACWFDYHGKEPCNAVSGALRALQLSVAKEPPPFWNIPPASWLLPGHDCNISKFDLR
eukprot:TRINITY_DN48288_c0_g1_i1.p1 TRINITY_DN48288_c0_g1~~TRINITY_DN48288_c0_g1_i1.p1  ORF type:complete len:582 (-),score=79.98 TRINITY_DN48288_c0_g1_i1:193-1938(-)